MSKKWKVKIFRLWKIAFAGVAFLALLPRTILAQNIPPQSFRDVVGIFINILQNTVPIIFSIAFLIFVWGLAKVILHGGNEREYAAGRRIMFYGVIAFFVMLSIWGILAVLSNTLLLN